MADIENLTIAINSSTKGASTNIDKLASSLEKLKGALSGVDSRGGDKLVKSLRALSKINNIKISAALPKRLTELRTAADMLKDADFSGFERLAAALSKFKGLDGIKIPKIMPVQTSIPGAAEAESGPIESGMVRTQASTENASFSLSDFIRHVKDMIANSKTASTVLKGMSTAFGYVGRAAKGVVGAIGGFFKSLGRVAFYRAIRAVLKDLVQGFKDLYGYSKANGTEFYKSMDRLTTSVTYLRNSIVAMISPLVNALAPAFDFLVDKIVNVLNWFNQLVSALSGAETYTVAKKMGRTWESTFDSAGNSASGANKKIKELKRTILGFDEINKLNANNDTAGRMKKSSSPYTDGYLNMFETRKVSSGFKNFGNAIQSALQDTLTRIQLIVSGALLAVGAILTFSGANIPLGIALMAAGAIGIVTAIAEKWDGLDPKVKGTITTIGLIVGGALLALGAILAFSGANIPVGIGLMAAGALSLGFTAKMNWETIKEKLQGPIGAITAVISGAFLLLGVVALFTGHIFAGLGLIAAGAVGLGVTAYLNWEKVKATLQGPMGQVVAAISAASLLLGVIALFTGHIFVGLGLIALGAAGLGTTAALNWEAVKAELQSPLGQVIGYISGAFLLLGVAALLCGNIPLGLTLIGAGAAGLGTTITANWDNIKEAGRQAIEAFKEGVAEFFNDPGKWIREHIIDPFVGKIKNLFGIHSPAALMKPVGTNVTMGILEGMKKTASGSRKWISTNVIAPIVDSFKDSDDETDGGGGMADKLWDNIEKEWNAGTRVLNIGFSARPTAEQLWSAYSTEWMSIQARTLYAVIGSKTTALALWERFDQEWKNLETRTVYISISTKVTAESIWRGLEHEWEKLETRTLHIGIKPESSADSMYKQFSKDWSDSEEKDEKKGNFGVRLKQSGWNSVQEFIEAHSGMEGKDAENGIFGKINAALKIGIQVGDEILDNMTFGVWSSIIKPGLQPVCDSVGNTIAKTLFGTEEENGEGGIVGKFKSFGDAVYSAFTGDFTKITDWLKTTFSVNWGTAWTGVVNGFGLIFGKMKELAKDPINGVIDFMNDMISKVETAINWIIGGINSHLKIDWHFEDLFGNTIFDWHFNPNLSEVEWGRINRLAIGGILDRATMLTPNVLAGEAGREAVLPLENHTEWMDTLASRVWETGMQNTEPSARRDDERMIDLMGQLLTEMRKFNEKEFSAEITTNSIAESTNRMNRRAGTVVIPVN